MRALILIGVLASCGGDDTYTIVTVNKRAAVHAPVKLEVTLSNAGSMRTDSLAIGNNEFPVTFSISAPGRVGPLGISIDAFDASGALVGRGAGSTTVGAPAASVMLDSADFVVNALYAGNQFLTNDFEAVGLQLAATNGTWTAVFREDCTQCTILGRRFDATGKPVESGLAAGDTQFLVNAPDLFTTNGSIPAIASSNGVSIVVWDFFDSINGVSCRAIDSQGNATTDELALTNDTADVVTAAGLPNGNFAVTWQTFVSPQYVVKGVIVTPACTPLQNMAPYTLSATGTSATRSHVAANGQTVLYAWVAGKEAHARTGPLTGTPLNPEIILVPRTSAMDVEHVRVAPWGNGFALAVRWASTMSTGPGKIEVYRISTTGPMPTVQGSPILITDKSGSDFASNQAFGIAQRSDGALMVAWHACPTGPGSCDVYGRILRPTGVPVGEPFVIPTTTGSDQVRPSIVALDDSSFVAAWNDSSGIEPDKSGSSVRARILYPVYDDARGVIGAMCGASAPGAPSCGEGLACAMGSDAVQRCFEVCTPPSCPHGGTCTAVDETTSACVF